jgi:quinoprotein glucose dehydrogenase
VYKDLLIMGNTVSEAGDAAPGYVRAYDVFTGKIRWIFHTMPQPGEAGYDTWPEDAYKKIGATNAWSGMVLDEKRGTVYFGTGSPASDFYGGERKGMNLYANCVMSLDAATGHVKWYYQVIHHDLWDRDMPCPPNLVTIKHNGKPEDVVVQATKDGNVYVLDRDSGTSLFPVEERPVPTKGLPGESPWPTQKYPLKPSPLCAQDITDSDITNISPEAHAYVQKLFSQFDHGNKFLPPSTRGTLAVGYSGGAEWGGNAIDTNGILYQNTNNAIWELQMISMSDLQKQMAALSKGQGLYLANCASCHGMNRRGNGREIPSLVNIGTRLKTDELARILKSGQGRMPSFQNLLSEDQRTEVIHFLQNMEDGPIRVAAEHKERDSVMKAQNAQPADFPYVPPYVARVWDKLTDSDGYPAIKPPWGTLNAIDLNTGDYLWRVPLGEFPELTKKGVPITGTESYGGPLATAGGLVFIAATRDEKIRAFDEKTGKMVWEYQLPAGGFATPITYEIDGKQYVVIAAGGGRGLKPGGSYIAFALPDKDIH